MGLLDKLGKFFESTAKYNEQHGLPEPAVTPPMPEVVAPKVAKPRKPRKPRKPKAMPIADPDTERKAAAKALATAAGEPWVDVIQVVLDPANVGNGSFELDWNDIFLAKLVRAGYKGKNDRELVEQWFTDVCRNVVLETYEQEMADPDKRTGIARRDLGNGRTEVS